MQLAVSCEVDKKNSLYHRNGHSSAAAYAFILAALSTSQPPHRSTVVQSINNRDELIEFPKGEEEKSLVDDCAHSSPVSTGALSNRYDIFSKTFSLCSPHFSLSVLIARGAVT